MKTPSTPILIIHQGALGDLMMSLPAFYSLRLFHAGIPWTMAGNLETLSLLHHRFYAQETVSIHRKEWALLFQEERDLPDSFRQYLSSFQKVYLFSARPKDLLIRGLQRAGVREAVWIPSFPDMERGVSLQTRQREILESEKVPWKTSERYLFPAPEDIEEARRLLNLGDEKGSRPLWAIHPGSGSPDKNWPLERFLETANQLKESRKVQPIFLWGPVEQGSGLMLKSEIQTRGWPILEGFSLTLLAGVLSHCVGYLGNDSGVSHLAAALGLPTVVLFGPTDPGLWSPQGILVRVLKPAIPCAPCDRETRLSCPGKACLKDLEVKPVVEVIGSLLSGYYHSP